MCGRYTISKRERDIKERIGLEMQANLIPRYNVAPSQKAPIIWDRDGKPEIAALRWGLIPSWAKDPGIANKLINARSETIAEKPSFRSAFKARRCLVIADGWYEWKPSGKSKTPYWIHREDRDVFAFAGLWERWHAPAGEEIHSFTIITTDANHKLRALHDRMPVIIARRDYKLWIDPQTTAEALTPLLRPAPDKDFEFHEVSRAVNKPGYDFPDCIEEAENVDAPPPRSAETRPRPLQPGDRVWVSAIKEYPLPFGLCNWDCVTVLRRDIGCYYVIKSGVEYQISDTSTRVWQQVRIGRQWFDFPVVYPPPEGQ